MWPTTWPLFYYRQKWNLGLVMQGEGWTCLVGNGLGQCIADV